MWNDLLQTHGYWVLALGCLLEGETILVLAGFAAHRGLLDPLAVVGIAAATGFAGDQGFFWLGRRHGAALLARWPSLARQSDRVQRLVERWHEALIIGVRFAYGLRIAGPVLIGMSRLSAWRFSAFNAIGAMLWATSVAAVGWAFGLAAEALLGELRHIEGWLFAGLFVVLGVFWLVRRRRAAHAEPPSGGAR
jgi:membrane protein DedA with SNARE-associated domain